MARAFSLEVRSRKACRATFLGTASVSAAWMSAASPPSSASDRRTFRRRGRDHQTNCSVGKTWPEISWAPARYH
jgi:hypothetical protein